MSHAVKDVVSSDSAERIEIDVELKGRDRLSLHLRLTQGRIVHAHLAGSGCPDLLNAIVEMRPRLTGPLLEVALPEGSTHAILLMRELVLRARGEWLPPYQDAELCHCRAVSTMKVDRAIVCGSHSIAAIARETSAGTSCGTCRLDTEALLAYRLSHAVSKR